LEKRWQRVCVFLPAGLGDVIKSSFWLREVKRQAQTVDLIAAGSNQTEELAVKVLGVADKVIQLSFTEFTVRGYLSYASRFFLRDMRRIRAYEYDLLLIPLANPLARFISPFVRAKLKHINFSPNDDVREEYARMADLGVHVSDPEPFHTSALHSERFLTVFSSEKTNIVVSPFCANSPGSPRDWRGFPALMERLMKEGYNLILVGNGELDSPLEGIHDLRWKTSISDLAWLIREADGVISIDSFPFHLAYALGTPVVGIFGPIPGSKRIPPVIDPGDVRTLHRVPAAIPEGDRHTIRRRVDPRNNVYTQGITVDEVISSLEALLKVPQGRNT